MHKVITRSHILIASTAALTAAFFLSSCSSSASARTGPEVRPKVLRYAFTSMSEDADTYAKRLSAVKGYLEKTLNMPVEVMKTSNSYSAVIEAFRANKIDLASISPFSYVIATQHVPIEAIVMRGSQQGEPGDYTGVLAVPGDSPIKSIDDVKRLSKDLTISFVDPDSTSGFLVQSSFFQSIGIEPERDFKHVAFSMSHPASLMTLKSHKVDIAATSQKVIDRYVQDGKIAASDCRVIWTSPEIPNQPMAVRKSLPSSFKEEIRRAFLDMHDKDPQAFKGMSTKAFAVPAGEVYVYANDAMFDGLRAMARGVKNLTLLEK